MVALPRPVQLAIACSGIFFSFSYFAVLQEDVYKKSYGGEYFKYTFLALVAERGINALIGLLGICVLGSSGLTIPHRDIFVSGLSQMLAMAGSNEALRYVSYPTQVLGKSCKMVPVMAGGLVLGGKSYSPGEYLQVLLITAGVCMFNLLGKKKKGGEDSALGLFLIGFSLLMDAATGGLQDKVKKRTKELNPDAGEKPTPTMHGAPPMVGRHVVGSSSGRVACRGRGGSASHSTAPCTTDRAARAINSDLCCHRVDVLDEHLWLSHGVGAFVGYGSCCRRIQVLLAEPGGAAGTARLLACLGSGPELHLLHDHAVQPARAHNGGGRSAHASSSLEPFPLPAPLCPAQPR